MVVILVIHSMRKHSTYLSCKSTDSQIRCCSPDKKIIKITTIKSWCI